LFANRFTVFVDACSLVGFLKRNLLLSLTEAEFFLRWSARVLAPREVNRFVARKGSTEAADGEPVVRKQTDSTVRSN
jgi:hypothetical protein